jgi:L-ascorbate metabolism protein UlaG (beta-lactamase superfamily)
MRIRWSGQSSFLLTGGQGRVFIDPFGDMSPLAARGVEWHYPPIEDAVADLLPRPQRWGPRLVVPMHYRTELGFLDPPDAFLEALGVDAERLPTSEFVAEEQLGAETKIVLLAPPAS